MSALENPDILRLVFECLEVDLPHSVVSKHNLVHVSQVCKAWLDPAMDSLWHHLSSLTPLLRLLPGFSINRGSHFLDIIEPRDWHKFDDYARRVRILSLASRPAHPDYVNLMVLRNRPEPLLMGLKELRVSGPLGTSDAVLALSPNIESVSLDGCEAILQSLISCVLTSCPRIRVLSWIANQEVPTNPHDITKFKDLRNLTLRLTGTYLSSSFMVGLGNIEGLQELAIDIGASDPSKISSSPRRGPPLASYPVATHKFTSLRKLHFFGPIEQIQRLLSFMDLKCLKCFNITERQPNVGVTESYWYQCFERLASSSHLEAIEIEQYHRTHSYDDKNHIAGSWIKPLCGLYNLKTLLIKGDYVRISAEELNAFASAFPALRVFGLPRSHEEASFSWASIAMLIDHWPQLQKLQITWGDFKSEAISTECNQKSNFHSHGLKHLSIAPGYGELPHQDVVLLARFLYRFFPHLTTLERLKSDMTTSTWSDVFDCYKALQADILYFRND